MIAACRRCASMRRARSDADGISVASSLRVSSV
jgi:hypothetical protein